MGLLVTYDQYGSGDINVTVALWINAFAAGVAMVCASPFVPRLRWGGSLLWRASRSSWQFSKWLVAASILAWAMGNLYYVVTSILLGPAAVGILRAAQSLLGVLNIFFLGIENVLPVQSSRKFTEGGITALNVYLKRAAVLGGVVTTIVAGFFAIAPQFWLDLLFGKSYGSGGALVQWMALGNIVLYLTVPAMVWLRTVEQTRHIFHAYLASAVVSAVVAYPAILYFGLRGAAIGMLISAVVNCATLAISIRYAWSKIGDQNANDRKRVEIYPMNLSSQ
jgi:O-antigen/teichoic acid export membrane protein